MQLSYDCKPQLDLNPGDCCGSEISLVGDLTSRWDGGGGGGDLNKPLIYLFVVVLCTPTPTHYSDVIFSMMKGVVY